MPVTRARRILADKWHSRRRTDVGGLMPTMSRLFRRAVPWTCLLLAAVTAAGCGTPGFTYAADTSAGTYFKVPFGWHKIDAASLTSQFNSVNRGFGDQNGLWDVAYDAAGAPSAVHMLN